MLNTTPTFCFCWQNYMPMSVFPTWYIWMKLWIQNCIFVHIWSFGDLDLGPSNFQKCLTLPQLVFLIDKNSYLVHETELRISKCLFVHIWLCGDFNLWISEMLNTVPVTHIHCQKVAIWYIWMELWIENFKLANIWSSRELGVWSLDLKFSEVLNTASINGGYYCNQCLLQRAKVRGEEYISQIAHLLSRCVLYMYLKLIKQRKVQT